jgi:hypothetical protein
VRYIVRYIVRCISSYIGRYIVRYSVVASSSDSRFAASYLRQRLSADVSVALEGSDSFC